MTFALRKLIVSKVVNIQRVYTVNKKSPISYRAFVNGFCRTTFYTACPRQRYD